MEHNLLPDRYSHSDVPALVARSDIKINQGKAGERGSGGKSSVSLPRVSVSHPLSESLDVYGKMGGEPTQHCER